jgi:hypothetical protein
MSAANIPSACRTAIITFNDAMILSYDATPGRMEFSERTVVTSGSPSITRRCGGNPFAVLMPLMLLNIELSI